MLYRKAEEYKHKMASASFNEKSGQSQNREPKSHLDMLKNNFKKLVATDQAKTLKFAKLCHSLYSSTIILWHENALKCHSQFDCGVKGESKLYNRIAVG